jgi:Mce-associated membrane protein
VDVADPGAADVTERRRRIPLSALVYVVLIALIAATVWTGLQLRSAGHREDARKDVVAAARQQAINLTSIDYRTAPRDLQRIIDGSTGDLQRTYRTRLGAVAALQQSKAVETGAVVATALVSYDGDRAQVAIAVNQTVSTAEAKDQLRGARRMLLDMKREHGRWLVTKQTFIGIGVFQ